MITGCPCGCGKSVTNAMMGCFPLLPWDSPGLPPRPKDERCSRHTHCAYRDDDPGRCPNCHGRSNCTCLPQWEAPTRRKRRAKR